MEGESQEAVLTAKYPQLCRRSKIMHAYRAHRDFVHRAVGLAIDSIAPGTIYGLACIHHPTGIANSQSLERHADSPRTTNGVAPHKQIPNICTRPYATAGSARAKSLPCQWSGVWLEAHSPTKLSPPNFAFNCSPEPNPRCPGCSTGVL